MTNGLSQDLAALCERYGVLPRANPEPVEFTADSPQLPDAGVDLLEAVTKFENALIIQAISRTHGNRAQAARLLRLNRTTLVEKIKTKLDTDPDFRARYEQIGEGS